jgi:hypothetical protein
VPLVPVNDSCETCCDGILTAQAAEMAWWQRITFGTTAWRISMGRRQVAESVNAALKGAFNDLGRGFMRVVGVTKMTVMLGFTVASYNLDRIRSSRPSTAWTRRVDRLRDSSKRARSGAPVLGPTSSSGHSPTATAGLRANRINASSRLPMVAGFSASRNWLESADGT